MRVRRISRELDLVQLLVAVHGNVQGFAAQLHAVLEGVEFCRGRYQRRILRLHTNFFFDAHILALVFEQPVGFIVNWSSRAAQRNCQAVSDAESCERLLFAMLWFEGAQLEDKSSIKDEEVKRRCRW